MSKFSQFRNGGNLTLLMVIHGHRRQSLGATGRRRGYFEYVTQQFPDRRKRKKAGTVDWKE